MTESNQPSERELELEGELSHLKTQYGILESQLKDSENALRKASLTVSGDSKRRPSIRTSAAETLATMFSRGNAKIRARIVQNASAKLPTPNNPRAQGPAYNPRNFLTGKR